MPSYVPSSPLCSITPSEAVANEPPTDVITASDPACQHNALSAVAAPGDSVGVESSTSTCATKDIAPAASSSKEMRHLVTVVSSDDAASETANATDDPALDEVTQKVVNSASTNSNGIASAPGTSHAKSVENCNDIITAVTSNESNKVDAGAFTPADSRDTAQVTTDENAAKKRKSEDPPTKKGKRTKKKAKLPKDPSAPKKNLTAYMHYATYARDYIKSRNQQMKATDITSKVQRDWNEMNSAHRNYWNDKAVADKVRYEREWADYKDSDLRKAWQARVDEESRARKVTSESIMARKSIERVDEYEAYARSYIKIRNPRMDDEEVTKVVLRGWSALTAEVRNFWDGVTAAAQLESLVQFYQRIDLTVKDVVEAKVSTQEILDDLCVEEE